jgi:hypothetical protein
MFKKICLFLLGVAQMGLVACNSQNVTLTAKFLNCDGNLLFTNTPVSFTYTFTFTYGTEITYELSEEMSDKLIELTPPEIIKNNVDYYPSKYSYLKGFYFNKSTTEPLTYGYKLYKTITVYYTIS